VKNRCKKIMTFCGIPENDIARCILEGLREKKPTLHRTSLCLNDCDGEISIVVAVLVPEYKQGKITGSYDVRETEVVEFENELVEIPTSLPSCDHYTVMTKRGYDGRVAKLSTERFTEIALIVVHTPNYAGCDFVHRWFEPLPVSCSFLHK
jgi:hypothetical protein